MISSRPLIDQPSSGPGGQFGKNLTEADKVATPVKFINIGKT